MPDERDRAIAERLYRQQQYRVGRRLGELKRWSNLSKVKGFMNDAADYTWLRNLATARRIRPMLGNLLADKALLGIGAALRQIGIPARVMYLSNAESYWAYTQQFRSNLTGMYFDERSWVVRTNSIRGKTGDYRYYLHAPQHFVRLLADAKVRYLNQVIPYLRYVDFTQVPLVVIDGRGKAKVTWSPSVLVKGVGEG